MLLDEIDWRRAAKFCRTIATVSGTPRQIGGAGRLRPVLRWLLGGALIIAGVAHHTTQRSEFQAQVPGWFPIDEDLVVIASGIVELALGAALIAMSRHRVIVGTIVAACGCRKLGRAC